MLVDLDKCVRGGFDKIETGIYGNNSGWYSGFGNWNVDRKEYECCDYGVADNIEQVKKKYKKKIAQKKNKYVIGFDVIKKSRQEENGGWRWHKWGNYIGKHKITTEYLFDEKIIEEVIVYNIYKVIKK